MTESPSLFQELANRAKRFHSITHIPQWMLAKEIDMEDSNYSSFLSGKRGIDAEATCHLLKFMAMSKDQAITAFSRPGPKSRIVHFQRKEAPMTLDGNDGSGWVLRLFASNSRLKVQ